MFMYETGLYNIEEALQSVVQKRHRKTFVWTNDRSWTVLSLLYIVVLLKHDLGIGRLLWRAAEGLEY